MRHKRIDPKLFADNRRRLAELLLPNSVAVVNANDLLPANADATLMMQPNSDLFYLTGIEQEETVLLMAPDAPDEKLREVLFLRQPSEHLKTWEGHKLSKEEALGRLQASNVLGGTFNTHCAAIHPARLVRGLARVVESLGVTIYEGTTVTAIAPGRAITDRGIVSADAVLLATEGFTPSIRGHRRDLVPMYSLMVATEPLPAGVWDRIGLAQRETFSDKRHLRIYGQRTADGRIAFGGRGAPYHFGSRIRPAFDRDERVHAMLRRALTDLLPGLPKDVRFTHAWGGNLGIPRDWYPSVWLDPRTRLGCAGGYVGDGVALSNVAGRVLADLVSRRESELTRLPFVARRSPRWEVEPLRWIGVNAVTRLFASADRAEAASGRPSRRAGWFWRAIGH